MRNALRHVLVALLAAISILYLLNFGFGWVEFLPDNLPIVGNLDEAAATLLLLNCLAYFGIDLRNFLRRHPSDDSRSDSNRNA